MITSKSILMITILNNQVSFHGRYDDRECGIRINSASVEDTGTWRFLGS